MRLIFHLLGFSAIDPQAMPRDIIALEKFEDQEIKSLASFYGSSSLISRGRNSVKPIANASSLEAQFDSFQKIVAAKRLKYESVKVHPWLRQIKKSVSESEK